MRSKEIEKIWDTMSMEEVVNWLVGKGYDRHNLEHRTQDQLKIIFFRVYKLLSEQTTLEIEEPTK